MLKPIPIISILTTRPFTIIQRVFNEFRSEIWRYIAYILRINERISSLHCNYIKNI